MNLNKLYLLAIALFSMQTIVLAQPTNPASGSISGVLYLLLAGLGFGVYSLKKRRK